MYSTVRWKLIMPATLLSVGMVFAAFGQSNPSASNSMSAAGDPMKQAGSDIADLTRHTHENAITVLRDPKITVKVKAALDEEGGTEHSDICVHTTTSSSGMPLKSSIVNDSPSTTKRSSEQSQVALAGKVQFHLFGSPCIQIASRLNSFGAGRNSMGVRRPHVPLNLS
jgi:hypothetical protein